MDGIESAFNALLNYSPMSLILGVVIALLSMIDVFLAKKTWKQRGLKILVVVLSVTLLFVQARSSKKAAGEEAERLQTALNKRRDQLTSISSTSTNQVIKGDV